MADAVAALAARTEDPAVRAQLHALGGIVRNAGGRGADPALRAPQEARIDAAIEAGDEAGVVAAMRALAALDRAAVQRVDWSAASRG